MFSVSRLFVRENVMPYGPNMICLFISIDIDFPLEDCPYQICVDEESLRWCIAYSTSQIVKNFDISILIRPPPIKRHAMHPPTQAKVICFPYIRRLHCILKPTTESETCALRTHPKHFRTSVAGRQRPTVPTLRIPLVDIVAMQTSQSGCSRPPPTDNGPFTFHFVNPEVLALTVRIERKMCAQHDEGHAVTTSDEF